MIAQFAMTITINTSMVPTPCAIGVGSPTSITQMLKSASSKMMAQGILFLVLLRHVKMVMLMQLEIVSLTVVRESMDMQSLIGEE